MRQTLTPGRDRSGSIAQAGVAQQVAPANDARLAMSFQNTSDTDMRLTESGVAASAANGFLIGPGDLVEIETTRAISVFCASAGKTFASTER